MSVGRRCPWLSSALGVASLVAASALAQEVPGTREAKVTHPAVLFIGDSITAGAMMAEPVGPPFPALVAERLAGPVENLGCSGTTTRDWQPGGPTAVPSCRSRTHLYEDLVEPRLPTSLVVILLGTNDAVGFLEEQGPVSAEEYGRSILELTKQLLDDGAGAVILMGPPRIFPKLRARDRRLREYRERILQICDATRLDAVHCGPDLGALLGPEAFQAGDVHPNGPAHERIAEALLAWCAARPDQPGCALSISRRR